jgi:hypothetical protein
MRFRAAEYRVQLIAPVVQRGDRNARGFLFCFYIIGLEVRLTEGDPGFREASQDRSICVCSAVEFVQSSLEVGQAFG